VPNSTPFKLWGIRYEKWGIKLKLLPTERKKRTDGFLVTTFNLVRHLKQLLLPRYVCLTAIDDRDWYLQWTLKIYWILMVSMRKKWTPIHCQWWSNMVPQFLIRQCSWVPNIRYCSRIGDVRHCSSVSEVKYCSWMVEVRCCCWVVDVPVFGQDADAEYLACHYYTALPRSVIAVVYCTKQ